MSPQWNCPKCGAKLTEKNKPGLLNYINHCPHCRYRIRQGRLQHSTHYPSLEDPKSIYCYQPLSPVTVLSAPHSASESLYLVGPGDLLPYLGQSGEFCYLGLPCEERGYALKSSGFIVEVGLGDIDAPLGYVRLIPGTVAKLVTPQPDGRLLQIGTLSMSDRLPAVQERKNSFKVQLPTRVRALVHKASVVRILSPDSVPSGPSAGLAAAAVGLGALVALGAIGALLEPSEETRMARAMETALRRRGL